MKFLGVLFLALLLSSLLLFLNVKLPGDYLLPYLNTNFIDTFAAIVGFNLASVTFLLGQLITIEATTKKVGIFNATRKEIKHNSYFLLISLVLTLIILIIRPVLNPSFNFVGNVRYYVCSTLALSLFFMALYAVYEILNAVFKVSKFFTT